MSRSKDNMEKLAVSISMREGKKSQVGIGNIREILKTIVDLEIERSEGAGFNLPIETFIDAVNDRLKKRKPKKTIKKVGKK